MRFDYYIINDRKYKIDDKMFFYVHSGPREQRQQGLQVRTISGYYLGSAKALYKGSWTGARTVHLLQTRLGTMAIWSDYELEKKMESVEPYTKVKITHVANENKISPKYKLEVDIGKLLHPDKRGIKLSSTLGERIRLMIAQMTKLP